MKIAPYSEQHQTALVSAWNRWLEPRFQIDETLLRQLTTEHHAWTPEFSRTAWREDELIGFSVARQGHIDAIAVAPDERRKGVATALLEGLDVKRFGGGLAHFVPGLPENWKAGEEWLTAVGFKPDWWAEDLHLHLTSRPATFTCCGPEDRESVLSMVGEEFSQRWTDDTRARFDAGDHSDVIILRDENGPVAFCHAWHYQSRLLGPSVFWLRNSCTQFGGIGPVGVRKRARGLGLGGKIVIEALNYLHQRGVQQVVVDWTSIGDFYAKYGFQSWQRYRGFTRE